jgi:hypothetical protein
VRRIRQGEAAEDQVQAENGDKIFRQCLRLKFERIDKVSTRSNFVLCWVGSMERTNVRR